MTESSLIVNLPQMVDLALGSPEVGAVNFNVLHALLHVLIKRVQLTDCTVEFRGPDSERVNALIASTKPGPALRLTEYQVKDDPEKSGKKVPATGKSKRQSSALEEEIAVISPRKDSKEEPKQGAAFTVPPKSGASTIILVERSSHLNLPRLTVAISENRFVNLESNVEKLNKKMTEIIEMPNNSSLMEAVRSQGTDKATPVIDMWQILNLNKRVDAAEAGVNKLASMVEDLTREVAVVSADILEQASAKDESATQKKPQEGENAQTEGQSKRLSAKASIFMEITNRLNAIEQNLKDLGSSKTRSKTSVKPATSKEKADFDEDDLLAINTELDTLRKNLKTIETDFSALTKGFKGKKLIDMAKDIEELKDLAQKTAKEQEKEEERGVSNTQVAGIEIQVSQLTQKLQNLDELFNTQLSALQEHLFEIEKEMGTLLERVNTAMPAEQTDAAASVTEIYNKVLKLQDELENVEATLTKINEEKDERQLVTDALVEQIELLKTIKADREDLEDALADKADRQHMNRKVSHDQFDAACGDLNRGIEEAMNKLLQQEGIWQTTLEELQVTIGSKIDKVEFDPLKDFVDKKIQLLQQRLKALMAIKQEQEAAGVKSKVLRDVNCLSCDKDVVIHKQSKFSTMPVPPALPATRSMKPYITYELDAVRKQQRLLPKGRNLNLLETALQEAKAKEKAIPATTHLCNRYCGGSHTITTPQQRVAHIGHFLNQWGPQVISLDQDIKAAKEGESPKTIEPSRTSATRESASARRPSRKLSKIVEAPTETEEKAAAESAKKEGEEKLAEEESGEGKKKSVRLSRAEQVTDEKERRKSARGSAERRPSTKSGAESSKGSLARSSRRESRPSLRKSGSSRRSSTLPASSKEDAVSESETNIPRDQLHEIIGYAEKIIADKSAAKLEPAIEMEEESEVEASEPISEPVTTDEGEEMASDAPLESPESPDSPEVPETPAE